MPSKFTHYISLPFFGSSEHFSDALPNFVEELKLTPISPPLSVLDNKAAADLECQHDASENNIFDVDASQRDPPIFPEIIFQLKEKLHITLLLLTKTSKDSLKKVRRVLRSESLRKDLDELFKNTAPPKIKFFGVKTMQDRASKAKVLYFGLKNPEVVLSLQNIIRRHFLNKHLVCKKSVDCNNLLHLTLVNAHWYNEACYMSPGYKFLWSIDARNILRLYSDYELEVPFPNRIELKGMSSRSDPKKAKPLPKAEASVELFP